MRLITKTGLLVVCPENELDENQLCGWRRLHWNHRFELSEQAGSGVALRDVGLMEPDLNRLKKADGHAINVTSRHSDPDIRLISNLATTPFQLDGIVYQSVESFWQGLKFQSPTDRARVARLSGREAMKTGRVQGYSTHVEFRGARVAVGSFDHWKLMELACVEKFTQNPNARCALLSTNPQPLAHFPRKDSKTIPGFVMAGIWTSIRDRLSSSASDVE